MEWWWWVVGGIAGIVLLPRIVFPGQRGSKNYMQRSHQRLDLTDKITGDLAAKLDDGTLDGGALLRLEGKLYALWEAQKKEKPAEPEMMNHHRDVYAKLIEFSFLKVRDLRTTGGENIPQINADQEAFQAQMDAFSERVDQEHADFYRRMGWAQPKRYEIPEPYDDGP